MISQTLQAPVRSASGFIKDLSNYRLLLWTLAVREFRSGHFGSSLGVLWVFIEPAIYMVLTFFVFNYALGVHPSGAHAYFPWLMSGMIGWNFFSGTLISGVSTFRSYSYLLNRWEFNMAVLPIVKIISGLFIHLIFVVLVILLLVVSHEHLHWAILQLPYYIFCASALLLGMIWMTASIHLFFRDISNLIGVLLQFGFWASPIFWELSKIPGSLRPFIKLNPMYYLITGYRETLLDGVPFWTHPIEGLYFWFVVSLFLWIGYFSYQRLRPDFGDLV